MDGSSTAAVQGSDRESSPRSWRGWFAAGALAVLITGLGAAFVLSFVGLYAAFLFVFGGLAYGIVGMIVIGVRWSSLPQTEIRERPAEVRLTDVHLFRTDAQRITLVLNVLLIVNLALAVVTAVVTGALFSAIYSGGVAEVAGTALIIVNAVWAYRRRYILDEQEAMDRRIGRYRLIRANRVLSYIVWSLHTIVAALLAASLLIPSAGMVGGSGY